MNRRADHLQPPPWGTIQELIGIAVVVILALTLMWCVHVTAVPHKFP